MKKDYYKILDVQKTASKEEIKKSYRALAKKYHPDMNKDNAEAQKRFQEINEAYSVLSDDDKKHNYDKFGQAENPFKNFDKAHGYNKNGDSKDYVFFNMKFSAIEIDHLLKAWLIISIAFAIAFNSDKLSWEFFSSFSILKAIIFSGITVGTAFLLHELAHKYFAQKYGCFAEFRADFFMLILALALSFTGFIFAAPGAVLVVGNVSKEKNGKISFAGPMINMILAFLFLGFLFANKFYFGNSQILLQVGLYGFLINAWIGLFNLIPFGIFDGSKIYKWHKGIYFTSVAICFGFLLTYFFYLIKIFGTIG